MNKITFSGLLLLSLLYLTCDAPRDNPLDSESDNTTIIEGSVQSFSLPYTPLQDVAVYWAISNSMVKTDAAGRFRIYNATRKDGYLLFQKSGYTTDSINVIWGNLNKVSVQMNLNRIPQLDTSFIYTTVINHPDGSRSFELIIRVKISDDDKDIDSVIVENSKLKIRKTLEYDTINKEYQLSLFSDEISLNDIEDIIGEDFTFFVIDIFGKLYTVGKEQVTRVIRTGASAVSPDNNAITDSLPLLSWTNFQPGFSLTYTIDVYKSDPINPQLVFRSTGIGMNNTSLKINVPLSPADYFWVIWTIDLFRNSSRSKPAGFFVR